MKSFQIKTCPKCGNSKLKLWKDLDEDQKFVAERVSGKFDQESLKKNESRFCSRCWYRVVSDGNARTTRKV